MAHGIWIDPFALYRLRLELDIWRGLGRKPILWWRDDDARRPTRALNRLLKLADTRPLTLAVIPTGDLSALAADLRPRTNLTIAQHGVDHANRRGPGEAPSEYEANTPALAIAGAILSAKQRMRRDGLEPTLYVPPWNRVQPCLPTALGNAGYRVLSAGSTTLDADGLCVVGAQIDILRWKKGPPRLRGSGRVLNSLRKRLRQLRRDNQFDAPTGLLTHHLVHDAKTWRFLAWFVTFADTEFAWRAIGDLVDIEEPARERALA